MLNSGKKKNILTLVLSEKMFLKETKNHNPPPPPPPFKSNGRSLNASFKNALNSQFLESFLSCATYSLTLSPSFWSRLYK